mmetsp:Transcript_11976/g.20219  ORF Transcript_11976/g.20219 Transcript_11976/m.20219 type:complete len:258 (-) Transcript_11976:25-798(-)
MLCQGCRVSLIDLSKRVFICRECSPDPENGEALYWCQKCRDATDHPHSLEKFKGMTEKGGEEGNAEGRKYLEDMLQEYYDLDCEDQIDGGKIKTRFKYSQVQKEDFGLTPEEILLLDDRQLNKLVSMKKLRPFVYCDERGNPLPQELIERKQKAMEYKVRRMKKELKQELELKKKLMRETEKANLELEKEKHLGTQFSQSKADRKKIKQEKKQKYTTLLGKSKKRDDDKEENAEQQADEVSDKKEKKRKRMAQYGIK